MAAPTWQGIVEIVLRALTIALVFVVFLAGAITVGGVHNLDSDVKEFIDNSDHHHNHSNEVPDTPDLVKLTRSDGGFLIFIAIVVAIYEVLAIVLRVRNLSLEKTYIIVFLVVDIIVSGILALVFLITGGVTASYADAWDDWVDFADDYFPDDDNKDALEAIHGATAAGAAFCIFEFPTFLGLAGWVLITLISKCACG